MSDIACIQIGRRRVPCPFVADLLSHDPATLEWVGAMPGCGAENVSAAVEAAAWAQPAVWHIPGGERDAVAPRRHERVNAGTFWSTTPSPTTVARRSGVSVGAGSGGS
jgi:hypothetical protein